MPRHAHVSGRYDADPAAFARYVHSVVTAERARSFTTTETYGPLKHLRRALGPDWIITRRGEYVIGVRRDTYRRTRMSALARMSHVYAGSTTWRDLFAHRRTFIHRPTGRRVLFVAVHAPSGVERGNDWKTSTQVRAWTDGVTRLGTTLTQTRRRRPGLVTIVGGDWNIDHHRPVWRRRGEITIGLDSCWTHRQPTAGTHGDRLIDAIYASAPLTPGRVSHLRRGPKLDHAAIVCGVDLTKETP